MKMRNGQVALYLVLTLVAITFLTLMNVGSFLAVSAKNKTMNAGDSAALSVAKMQGELLNRIGEINIGHLKAAIENDEAKCEELMEEQLRKCFLGPLEGIRLGNDAAKANGIEKSDAMEKILKQHVIDIRTVYIPNPQFYPAPWEGAWEEYAQHLELAIGDGIYAGPDNVDFVDMATGHYLLNKMFYSAIAGRNWCWFHFNAPELLGSYTNFRSWAPLPLPDVETRRLRCCNSEVYSLHLDPRKGSAVEMLGTNLIVKLTDKSIEDIMQSHLITNKNQVWFFYGEGVWRKWWEIDPDGAWRFPVVGPVKPQYDVRGAAAICRVTKDIPNVVSDNGERVSVWAAAAKPFGSVENDDGEEDVVTQLKNFVTPAFTAAKLVPLDSVGGKDLSTADAQWMNHVRNHLPKYMKDGPDELHGCFYCSQLKQWEKSWFREQGTRWLKYNSADCVRGTGPGPAQGGTAHGH